MRHRRIVLCSSVVALVLAVPAPAPAGTVRLPARQAPAGPTEFFSSFEAGDPQPVENTVETDATGRKKSDGVIGASFIAVPGSVTDQVADITVSGENPDGGEVKANLIDSNALTKWLTFAPTATIMLKLRQPVAVSRYALTSANDVPGRDPRDWTLSGSNDGTTWSTVDSRRSRVAAWVPPLSPRSGRRC